MTDDNNGLVGYWIKNANKLSTLDRARFAQAVFLGINFFIFDIRDVNIDEKTINGLFYSHPDGEYRRKVTRYPDLFDYRLANSFERKYPKAFDSIKADSYVVQRRGIGTKKQVAKKIEKGKFAHYGIKTYPFDINVLEQLLNQHKLGLVLKPNRGSNGKGIYKVTPKSEGIYTLHYLETRQDVSYKELVDDYISVLENAEDYLIQEYIDSTTRDGVPMDVRLNVARGLGGEFGVTACYCRYGSKEYLGTNMGKASRSIVKDVLGALKWHFGEDKGKELHDDVIKIGKLFPEEFQKTTSFLISELALDIGINRATNTLHFFEVGVSPGTLAITPYEVAEQNVGFYKYLFKSGVVK